MLVATILRNAGYDIDVIDASTFPSGMEGVKQAIAKYNYLIVLTSTMSCREDSSHLISLKEVNPGLKTIAFGAHPTFMPKQTLFMGGIDIVIMREPELVIKELFDAFKRNDNSWFEIKGIGWRDGENVKINEFHTFIENLDDLPIADRDLLPQEVHYFNPIVKRIPYTTMITSKGCPGLCIFCSSPPFYGRKYRMQSAPRVLEEMEYLCNKGYKEIFFRDETFTASSRRVAEICEGIIKRKLDVTWICSSRVGAVDYELMCLMKKAGCHMLRIGVETGVQELLDRMKKGVTLEQTEQMFSSTHKAGIDTHAHCMLGVPGETEETIKTTIKFVKKIDPTIATFGICTPYPGTELFEMVKNEYPAIGDGSQCDLSKLHTVGFFNQYFTKLSSKYLESSIRKAYGEFYLRPRYILKWLYKIRSMNEFRRVVLAGTQVFEFIGGRD